MAGTASSPPYSNAATRGGRDKLPAMMARLRRLASVLLARLALALALLTVTTASAVLTMRAALSLHVVQVPLLVGKGVA
jgi:hypothetical protein